MIRMILERNVLWRLHLGNPLIDRGSYNHIWAVHIEPGNAYSPYVWLQNRPNRRRHAHTDIGVPLTMRYPVLRRPSRDNNRSWDRVCYQELDATGAKPLRFIAIDENIIYARYQFGSNPVEPSAAFSSGTKYIANSVVLFISYNDS